MFISKQCFEICGFPGLPKPLFYFSLFMERMLPVKGTILLKFQLFLNIPAVFLGGIVTPLTFAALQGYQFNRCLFTRHFSTS
jgi:hypothetical protein